MIRRGEMAAALLARCSNAREATTGIVRRARVQSGWATGLALSCALFVVPAQSRAYPIDCAILLCLAGGWTPNPTCLAAHAEFVRRVTPWPVEPPLQIWRCPMRGGAVVGGGGADDGADVDISDEAFDFVRSVRVFQIDYSQYWGDGSETCWRTDRSQRGVYGEQGEFSWQRSSAHAAPAASGFRAPGRCEGAAPYRYRSIFVDWRSHDGTYGWEEVRY